MPEAASSLVIGGSEDEPLVLSGPPSALSGRIHVQNPSSTKVVLRDAGLRDRSGVLRLPHSRHAFQPFVLRPDQGRSLPISVALDRATPPGDYRAELDIGGGSCPVLLHVAEVVDLSAEPKSLVVMNRPGLAQKKRLIVTNEGNVAFALGDPTVVDLREDPPAYHSLRVAIESVLDSGAPDQAKLVLELLEASRRDELVGRIEVTAKKPVEIQPGDSAAIDVELTLQDELPATRRYRGRLPVLTRDVDVIVIASDRPPRDATPQAPARARAASAKKTPPKRGAKR